MTASGLTNSSPGASPARSQIVHHARRVRDRASGIEGDSRSHYDFDDTLLSHTVRRRLNHAPCWSRRSTRTPMNAGRPRPSTLSIMPAHPRCLHPTTSGPSAAASGWRFPPHALLHRSGVAPSFPSPARRRLHLRAAFQLQSHLRPIEKHPARAQRSRLQ